VARSILERHVHFSERMSVKAQHLSPTSIEPRAFKVPVGFSISVFAEGLAKPQMLEIPTLLASRRA
jgi:hypothetical protein